MTSFAEKKAQFADKAKEVMDDAGGVISRARGMFSGDAQFFSVIPSKEQLRKALDDNAISTKKDGMKGVLAQMCLGMDMSSLFPDVVRNIHAPSIELRKFIYTFIIHYCDERPNEALLSISAFQKDLLDRSIHVRSLALRVLSSIRLSSIQPVVMLAIKKSMTDISPLVRRSAAIALIKAHRISKGDNVDQAVEVIAKLIGDRHMDVVGAAATAWLEICPTRYDLIHREFRKLCRQVGECNEWAQIPILQMLLRYCRSQFSDPNKQIEAKQQARWDKKEGKNSSDDDSDSDSSDSSDSGDDNDENKNGEQEEEDANNIDDFFGDSKKKKKSGSSSPKRNTSSSPNAKKPSSSSSSSKKKKKTLPSSPSSPDMDLGTMNDIDNDHRTLLQSIKGLLHSSNRSVVLHTISIYYHCAPTDMLDTCAKPLLRVLNGPKEYALPALVVANSVIAKRLNAFLPYVQDFFPLPTDSLQERDLKLRIMAKLATRDNLPTLTKELTSHFRVMEIKHTIAAVQGMALIAFTVPVCARDILRQLLPLLSHKSSDVVSEVVVAVRQVVCLGHDATQTLKTIQQLARGILSNKIKTPQARASVLWLVADNLRSHPTITKMAPDMFRHFLASYKEDPLVVRRQLLFLGQKIFLNLGEAENDLTRRFNSMLQYLLELIKFDESYDLRDVGNMLTAALDRTTEAYKLLKANDDHATSSKPTPELQDPFGDRSGLELTSMSHLVGYSSLKNTDLPEWGETCSASSLRDPPESKITANPLDDSDSTTTEESDTTETTSASSDDGGRKGGKNSDSDTSSSSDDDDADVKKPTTTKMIAPAATKPKIQVAIKTIVKPSAPAPGKGDRILQEFFTPAAKPAAKSSSTSSALPKHSDPNVASSSKSKEGSDDE